MASLPYPRRPLKSSHRIHGIHRSFWRRRASHRFHRCSQMVRLRRVLPRNSRNSQKLLAEKSLPRMRIDAHRWLGCVGFSHGIHGIHRSFWRRRASHRFHRFHRWFGCVGFSHGIHGIHRSFWRRRASHRFHRCSQMVRLRRVLWEDSLVAAWVWQGCHTLLICAHPCNL